MSGICELIGSGTSGGRRAARPRAAGAGRPRCAGPLGTVRARTAVPSALRRPEPRLSRSTVRLPTAAASRYLRAGSVTRVPLCLSRGFCSSHSLGQALSAGPNGPEHGSVLSPHRAEPRPGDVPGAAASSCRRGWLGGAGDQVSAAGPFLQRARVSTPECVARSVWVTTVRSAAGGCGAYRSRPFARGPPPRAARSLDGCTILGGFRSRESTSTTVEDPRAAADRGAGSGRGLAVALRCRRVPPSCLPF